MKLNANNILEQMAKVFFAFSWDIAVSQFNTMIIEKMISAANDFLQSIDDNKLIENVVELRKWLVSMKMEQTCKCSMGYSAWNAG